MSKKIQSIIFLTLCAMIWGFAFVAQRSGMDYMGPFFFSALRMYIGSISLVPVIFIFDRIEKSKSLENSAPPEEVLQKDTSHRLNRFTGKNKILIQGGLICGTVIFFASNFQQVGLVFTTAAKTGFITTLYIVLVPIFGLFLKQKVGLNAWVGVIVAACGLYFLCLTESLTITFGDFVVLIGSGFWAAHILFIDHFAPKVNVMKLICLQFIVAGTLSLIVAFFTEELAWSAIVQTAPALLYVGIFSSGIAFTFQALGQKYSTPTASSLILSTESVFAALGGVIVLHEVLSTREWIGCILMFIAVIVAQLPKREKLMK